MLADPLDSQPSQAPAYNNPVLWSLQPAISWGLYFASFIHCVRWLLFEDEGWRIRKKINWSLVATTLLIFCLSTALFCAVAMQTLWYTVPDFPGVDFLQSTNYYALTILNSSAIQWSILMVIDSVMIQRCWIVFAKNWFIICFPFTLWCFCLTCAILSFYCYLATPELPFHAIMPDSAQQMCNMTSMSVVPLTFYVCNIVINIYTTSALVFKIWRAAKNNLGTNRLYRICRILAESGILYTLSSIVYLISWILSSTFVNQQTLYTDPAAAFLVQPVGIQIVVGVSLFIPGIAFNLIIIRVGEQRANGEDTWVDSRNARKILTPSELLNHPDTSTQVEMGRVNYERMEEREVMEVNEINETEAREIMELARTPSLD